MNVMTFLKIIDKSPLLQATSLPFLLKTSKLWNGYLRMIYWLTKTAMRLSLMWVITVCMNLPYHGVPLVCFPLSVEQHANAKKAEHVGLGLAVYHDRTNTQQLSKTIELVINEPR